MSLYRAQVVPIPKRQPKTCSKPLCVVGNQCLSCRNATSRAKGQRAQDRIASRLNLGGLRYRSQRRNEENWRGPFRREAKSGAQCNTSAAFFLAHEAQSEARRPVGDTRAFQAIWNPEGWGSECLVVMRLSDWVRDVEPLVVEP